MVVLRVEVTEGAIRFDSVIEDLLIRVEPTSTEKVDYRNDS